MSPLVLTMLVALAMTLLALTALWLVSVWKADASIVDPFWGTGFALVAVASLFVNRPPADRAVLIAVLTAVWGLRLSAYLLVRNWGHGEDHRYAAMRAHHGPSFWWVSLFTVYWLQALILWFVSLPIQAVAAEPTSTAWNALDLLGTLVYCVGLAFESIGDWQLARFKRDPSNRGRVFDRGLWRYTRHPNYFGDACVWWGLFAIAAAGGHWWTVVSPLVMTTLLLKVSGVSLLEKSITERRPAYAEYQARTNAFLPGPPREPRQQGR